MYSRRTVEEVEAITMAGAVAQAAVTIVGIESSTRSAATRSERRGKRANDSELSSRVVAVLVFFSAALAYLVVAKLNNRNIASRKKEREIVGKSGFEFRDSERGLDEQQPLRSDRRLFPSALRATTLPIIGPPFHPSGPSRTFTRGGPEGSQWSPDFDIVALPRE
ncbi:hypothetical protein G5I_01580 [Acromyrmex echinatior]|uniref:Transmembrane protein n=1 Tax=Acromyrmex echinatior TaxID=103372 RepID=F4W803_ACREC|nr:hypothetical protein G5I_01580 [Acromyrmex echinatior]